MSYKIDQPEKYKCSKCGAAGVRLWRQYQTFADHIDLLCLACGEADQKRKIDPRETSIGWLVLAVPTADGSDTYWGYTSVPDDGLDWWKALPIAITENGHEGEE